MWNIMKAFLWFTAYGTKFNLHVSNSCFSGPQQYYSLSVSPLQMLVIAHVKCSMM